MIETLKAEHESAMSHMWLILCGALVMSALRLPDTHTITNGDVRGKCIPEIRTAEQKFAVCE